ncbi:hypothetical protein DL766_004269 [Monosporascus sp. MC13-8B]|uniref:Kinesin-like protein n=1 Tax=Monosporascus cannonballus TaxID=155416 RepID=A0ABY0HDD0_9PEZI|nr:hypothetical protein DL762_003485 [Monosporascus cannonballus]RYO98571.1 hypothetical protein DL763_002101 [Monosporascus cannonballus]RYP31727.1 hypothetical protein DL766_004269 [Monosporascus sp. MC13-8B]
MEPPSKSQANLFQVYLRLRPPPAGSTRAERFLSVEDQESQDAPTHIALNPPNDRRRAIEKFAFTQVNNVVDCNTSASLEASIRAADASEASIYAASAFLETVYSDLGAPSRAGSRAGSRAATPLIVRPQRDFVRPSLLDICPQLPGLFPDSPGSVRLVRHEDDLSRITLLSTPPSERPRGRAPAVSTAGLHKPKLAHTQPPKKHYMSLTSAAKRKNVTKTPTKGDYPPPQTARRQLQRPSAMPQAPSIGSIRASCDPSAEYAIVISMYEVYNDRIFDLLTPPIKSNATKEYRRRPLLFKSTELSSDRKVVAGLRKIVCGSLKEALMVLEAGLHERRVAGTGSNSVSSRSHGFFCVEVKKRRRGRSSAQWGSSTLSIVDLAGSERARDAKTQGATLAEAGKINESLMYLGQCLQIFSDPSNMAKPNLVPFRQCKLTELLFTNSFPSGGSLSQSTGGRRNLQKAVMIVTVDPHGDFNATSQILRYSALAREVTVPRVPSTTSTILGGGVGGPSAHHPSSSELGSSPPTLSSPLSSHSHSGPFFQSAASSGNHSHSRSQRTFSPPVSAPDTEQRGMMENAALEIARMSDVIDQLHAELARETEARVQAEAHLLSLEDRVLELEQDVREECYADFEHRLALEMSRWKASLDLELERGTEHWDRKADLMARIVVTSPSDGGPVESYNDENENDGGGEDKENVLIENLEQENERLRREVAVLRRELASRTPTRRAPLQERGDVVSSSRTGAGNSAADVAGLGSRLEGLRVSSSGQGGDENKKSGKKGILRVASTGSPTKKVRRLPAKKWNSLEDVDDDEGKF